MRGFFVQFKSIVGFVGCKRWMTKDVAPAPLLMLLGTRFARHCSVRVRVKVRVKAISDRKK